MPWPLNQLPHWQARQLQRPGGGRGREPRRREPRSQASLGARSRPDRPRSGHSHRHKVAPRKPPAARLPWPPRAARLLRPLAPGWRRLSPGTVPTARREPPSLGCQTLSTGQQGREGPWASSTASPHRAPASRGPGQGSGLRSEELAPGPGPDGTGPGGQPSCPSGTRTVTGCLSHAHSPAGRCVHSHPLQAPGDRRGLDTRVRGGPMTASASAPVTDPGWRPMRPGRPRDRDRPAPRAHHCSPDPPSGKCFLILEEVTPR